MKAAPLKRIAFVTLRILVLSFLGFCILLLFEQHGMIYHPRPYAPNEIALPPQQPDELRFKTSQGSQLAFYLSPKNSAVRQPEKIWVMFAGNASLALDWRNLIDRAANPGDGFLLIDYPGYGGCEGSASPATIAENAEKALSQLGTRLGLDHDSLEKKLNAAGHSIGCGAALEFSVHHPVREIILIAPFTSLRDMARRVVGFPLCCLLLHNFNNRARLAELAAQPVPPLVFLFHGSEDQVIPEAMGKELAAMFPKMIRFKEIPGADHNSIVHDAVQDIREAMQQQFGQKLER